MTTRKAIRKALLAMMFVPALLLAASVSASAQTAERASGLGGDIKVHGHWTIVARNPDGTIVSQTEIENALMPDGGRTLARLLQGSITPGAWVVWLDSTIDSPRCNANNSPCAIGEGQTGNFFNSNDLTVTVPETGPNAGRLVLRGTVRAPRDTVFGSVTTELLTCGAGTAPSTCTGSLGPAFSAKDLTSGIPVVAEQIVDVTVVFSFS